MVWFGMDLRDQLIRAPLPWQGHLPLDQGTQSPKRCIILNHGLDSFFFTLEGLHSVLTRKIEAFCTKYFFVSVAKLIYLALSSFLPISIVSGHKIIFMLTDFWNISKLLLCGKAIILDTFQVQDLCIFSQDLH